MTESRHEWHSLLRHVQRAASCGDWSNCTQSTNAMLRRWGNNPNMLLDVVSVLIGAGELRRCEELMLWCHQLQPQAVRPLINLGNIWLQSLRQEQAISLYSHLQPTPNLLMALSYQVNQQASTLREWTEYWGRMQGRAAPKSVLNPKKNLRLGFISADLCQHPVGLFLLPLAEELVHDSSVEIHFFDERSRTDWTQRRLQDCGSWHVVAGAGDKEVSNLIRSQEIDVLIELSGHTARSRLPVLLHRPAPIQMSWLGYWATTGLPEAVDAVITDEELVPAGSAEEQSFCEPVIRLPKSRWCYQPVPWMPEVVDPPCVKRGWVTFGSFNSSAKLNKRVLRCWTRILKQVPESRLLLKNYQLRDEYLKQRIRQFMSEQGIHSSRLELEGPSSHSELLKTYSQIDIALDPFPFNGGLTSCEALWLGLPLVTLIGNNQAAVMAARQGMALLKSINRPEWIGSTEGEYVEIASQLAEHPHILQHTRHTQRARMLKSPLCDAKAFARSFIDLIRQRQETQSRIA